METKNNIEYPFGYQDLGPEETEELKQYFTPLFTKVIRLGEKGYFFYEGFESTASDIYNMEVRPSDTWVVTFPRSGTTWTQELVWLLQNDCDFEKAKASSLSKRFPFIESGAFVKIITLEGMLQNAGFKKFIEEIFLDDPKSLDTLPSPRFIKSHLPLSLLPPSLLDTAKVVYVARDPRDVAISNFFHFQSGQLVPQDREFKPYWNFFIQNKVIWSPFFEHVKEAWNQRNHPNMFFIFYEELSKDLSAVARRLATFLGKQYSEETFEALCSHLKFDNFKNNSSVNWKEWQDTGITLGNFIRQGKSGGWREHFDAEMTQQAKSWIADNLRDTDLRFPPP